MVKFHYDPDRCDLPYDPREYRPTKCLVCLDVCPHSLLMFRPMEEKGEDGGPQKVRNPHDLQVLRRQVLPRLP